MIIATCELALLDLRQRLVQGEGLNDNDLRLNDALIHTLKNVKKLGWEAGDYVAAVATVVGSPLLATLRDESARHRSHDPGECADARLLQAVASLERWYWDGRAVATVERQP